MDNVKQQLVDKLKTANNILVTVSRDPSVDQLSACLGLALLLNKQGKHTAAVFSGQVPSTIEFLKPEDTLEQNTDSLRDFIIALDKSKADKLRYKVEDNVVRIFITPYKTSIGQDDLEFSQGDFNVDVVVALGVDRQEDLDEAITAHGRILHDATVASVNISADGQLGSINWHDPKASSLSELVTELGRLIEPTLIDEQIATALLTGIVSATDRFSNDKTSSQTMSISATLMAAGANQQLVASKLEEPAPLQAEETPEEPETPPVPPVETSDEKSDGNGIIEINHAPYEPPQPPEPVNNNDGPPINLPEPAAVNAAPFDAGNDLPPVEPVSAPNPNLSAGSRLMTEPPSLGGTLTANSQPPTLDPTTDPMSLPLAEPPQLLEHTPEPPASFTPPPADWTPPPDSPVLQPPADITPPPADPIMPPSEPPAADSASTLSDLEQEVQASKQQADGEAAGLDTARDEVDRALNTAQSTLPPKPIEALNAQPLGDDLHPTLSEILGEQPTPPAAPAPSDDPPAANDSQVVDPMAPPPVPPPIPFQFGSNPPSQ